MKNYFVYSLLFWLAASLNLKAQYVPVDSAAQARYVNVETVDGNEFEGLLLQQELDFLILKTEAGIEIKIETSKIELIAFYDENPKSFESKYHNLQSARYFFGPNAYNLKRGEGYYQNNWVFLNQVSIGLSDRFSIGIGTVPLFLFGFGAPSPIWITPKVSFPLIENKVNAAVGGLFGTVLGEDFNNTFGVTYGAVTLGNRDRNINFSLGFGMTDGVINETPTLSISGMLRIGRKFYLLSENYLIFDELIISLGGRSLTKSIGLDYGLIFLPDNFGALIPWLGISVPFKIKAKS